MNTPEYNRNVKKYGVAEANYKAIAEAFGSYHYAPEELEEMQRQEARRLAEARQKREEEQRRREEERAAAREAAREAEQRRQRELQEQQELQDRKDTDYLGGRFVNGEFQAVKDQESWIAKHLKENAFYQEETGFVHDGMISIGELINYEQQIRVRGRAMTPELKKFRNRVAETMMVDHSFAKMMSTYSPKYEKIRKEAKEEKKNLEWKANVSGFSKVIHAVGKEERAAARQRLADLERTKQRIYREPYDTDKDAAEWLEKGSFYDIMKKSEIKKTAEEAAEGMTRGSYYGKDQRMVERFSHAYKYGQKLAPKLEDAGLSLTDAVSLLYTTEKGITLGSNNGSDWIDVMDHAEKMLRACGVQGEGTQEEQLKAFVDVTNESHSWYESLYQTKLIQDLAGSDGDPLIYREPRNAMLISKYWDQSTGLSRILTRMKNSHIYKELDTDQKNEFDAIYFEIMGLQQWLGAHADNILAWNDYYYTDRNAEKIMDESIMPKKVRKLSAYMFRGN